MTQVQQGLAVLPFNSTLKEQNSKWEMYEQNDYNYSHFKQLYGKKVKEKRNRKKWTMSNLQN